VGGIPPADKVTNGRVPTDGEVCVHNGGGDVEDLCICVWLLARGRKDHGVAGEGAADEVDLPTFKFSVFSEIVLLRGSASSLWLRVGFAGRTGVCRGVLDGFGSECEVDRAKGGRREGDKDEGVR